MRRRAGFGGSRIFFLAPCYVAVWQDRNVEEVVSGCMVAW